MNKPTPPSVTRAVTDFSALLQDPEITQIATPAQKRSRHAQTNAPSAPNDPMIRLGVSFNQSFLELARQLARETQFVKPGHENLSLLLRNSLCELYKDNGSVRSYLHGSEASND